MKCSWFEYLKQGPFYTTKFKGFDVLSICIRPTKDYWKLQWDTMLYAASSVLMAAWGSVEDAIIVVACPNRGATWDPIWFGIQVVNGYSLWWDIWCLLRLQVHFDWDQLQLFVLRGLALIASLWWIQNASSCSMVQSGTSGYDLGTGWLKTSY